MPNQILQILDRWINHLNLDFISTLLCKEPTLATAPLMSTSTAIPFPIILPSTISTASPFRIILPAAAFSRATITSHAHSLPSFHSPTIPISGFVTTTCCHLTTRQTRSLSPRHPYLSTIPTTPSLRCSPLGSFPFSNDSHTWIRHHHMLPPNHLLDEVPLTHLSPHHPSLSTIPTTPLLRCSPLGSSSPNTILPSYSPIPTPNT